MIKNDRKTPQLRVCVTPYCNLRCKYCRPGGEGYYENLHVLLSADEIITIISLAAKAGFTHVKFTGGEPLLRRDLVEIIRMTKRIPGIQEIQMVTNGTLLVDHVPELKTAGLDCVTISLDAIDPEIFREIRGVNLAPILQALHKCREVGLPVRINMVVMKSNFEQISPMIELAMNFGCSLKLLDLFYIVPDDKEHLEFWRREFVHFDLVHKTLTEMGANLIGLEEAPGGIGAPLLDYRFPDGTQVVVQDSTRGGYYHPACKSCRYYPCQDALISVRVTHDGHLKRCLIRNDNLIPVLPLLRKGLINEAFYAIKDIFDFMVESRYYPFAWNPESVKSS